MEGLWRYTFRIGILFSTLLLRIGLPVFGQEGEYTLKWTDNHVYTLEDEDRTYTFERLHFEGAFYEGNDIPVYAASIPLSGNTRKFFLEEIRYEAVPDSIVKKLFISEMIGDKVPRADVFPAGEDDYALDIRIPALRVSPETLKPEKLVAFRIGSEPRHLPADVAKGADKSLFAVDNSLLGSGSWYKFKVNSTGIYKLTYNDLTEIGLSNPGDVRIYGHGGRQLSYWNSDPRPADMVEIPLYMNKGSDGNFGEGDFILFYAEGPVTWDYYAWDDLFRQKIHAYSGEIFYFISDSQGEATSVPEVDNSSLIPNVTVGKYDLYRGYEREWYNLIGSGRRWFSRRIDVDAFDTTFVIPGMQAGDTVRIEAVMAGRSKFTGRRGYLYVNDQEVESVSFPSMNFSRSYYKYASDSVLEYSTTATGSEINIGVSYNKQDQTDEAYLDYITLNARCDLVHTGDATRFRDSKSVGEGNVAQFNISGAGTSSQVWDITDINHVFSLAGNLNGSTFSYKAPADTLRQYVIFDLNGDFPKPIINSAERGVGEIQNQNLRNLPPVNYIIVAPTVFEDQADRLAEFHRHESNLSVKVVNPQHIFNEFSSGTPDATAMRDFFRYQYYKGDSEDRLRYVLLFGDGSFNNHIHKEGNTNYILTYQSEESLSPGYSYTSDDYYGMLDDGEGNRDGDLIGKLDIGIGRLPVKALDGTDFEAKGVVDKLLAYYSSDYSEWRRRLCFVGDDGYDPGGYNERYSHMSNADTIAKHAANQHPGFELKKVYLDAYPQVSSATGDAYPDVNEELQNLFSRGILTFCYSGHGSENQITGEIILQKSDLQTMTNRNVLPLFITATCSFSRYDHVDIEEDNNYAIEPLTSAGEEGILNHDGGAVALLSTSRVVYSTSNTILAKNVFTHLFRIDENGDPLPLGEVIRLAKNMMGQEINKLNFTLLGDPAMILNFPRYKVCTDSVNGLAVGEGADTLKAFSLVTVSGYVAYNDSTIISNFNGYVYPNVYDKAVKVVTFGNDNQPPFTYWDQKNLLYKGKATVTNGRFKFSFMVPKDIAYNIDKGKISYYAENGVIDARGEFRDVYIGGTDLNTDPDYEGPEIKLFMNDNRFEDGGITNTNPFIYAELSDQNGINTTGVGIGHDIVAILDDTYHKPYVLNDYYEASVDDFTRGIVMYPLKNLEEGEHYIDMKVWDVFNNSSEASIGFVVMSSDDLLVDQVLNYPNPAVSYTDFVYTHNAPDTEHEVTLEVFDLMGRLLFREKYKRYESGFVSQPIHWDISNSNGAGIGSGVYPYRLQVSTPLGSTYINNRLIIIR